MSDLKKDFLNVLPINEEVAYNLNSFLANNPELSGHEFMAVEKSVEILKEKGIEYEENYCGVPTSFLGHIIEGKSDEPKIGIVMEYDALPEIGHGCGHSASGSLSMLAALSLWEMRDKVAATIDLIGTPNEETVGDKITLGKAGAFDDYDFVIMIHMNSNITMPAAKFLALSEIKVNFEGYPSHAAAAPWNGINALNSAILTTNSIDMLRQQLKPDTRVSYIITKGGTASNVIPENSEMIINMRASKKKYLESVFEKVENCIKGSALSTEATYSYERTGEDFDDMNLNQTGIKLIDEVMTELNVPHKWDPNAPAEGSSDIGNVSYLCPAFHPMLAISDREFSMHTKDVADIMKSPEKVNPVILTGSKIIGLMILKALGDRELLSQIKEEFDQSIH